MHTIESVYTRAKDAHAKCQNRTIRIGEVKELIVVLWEDLFSIYREGSTEWRTIDRVRKEHTDWWTVPELSDYAQSLEQNNIYVILKVIEKLTGKGVIKTAPHKDNLLNSFIDEKLNQTTGRTKWDFFSELHRYYRWSFFIVAVGLLAYLGWP